MRVAATGRNVPAMLRTVLALTALLAAASVAQAQARQASVKVDVELVLAVDISYSIDEEEAKRQRDGYVAALAHPNVMAAIQGGPHGRIAVTYMEWADEGLQRLAAPWAIIGSESDALSFAAVLNAAPLERGHYTAIGSAMNRALDMIETNNIEGDRKVIDISGDGPQNQGDDLAQARERAIAAEVIVNGLPIVQQKEGGMMNRRGRSIDAYYAEHVIAGPYAFIVRAESFDEFRTAVMRKLILEIADAGPAAGPGVNAAP